MDLEFISYGNGRNIPLEDMTLKQKCVAWAKTDQESYKHMYCISFDQDTPASTMLCLPCFWPHLIVFCIGPWSLYYARNAANQAKDTMWVITDEALVIITPKERTNIPWTSIMELKESTTDNTFLSVCGKKGSTDVKMITVTLKTLLSVNTRKSVPVTHKLVGVNDNADFYNKLTNAYNASGGAQMVHVQVP